jgi:hypothetical protein
MKKRSLRECVVPDGLRTAIGTGDEPEPVAGYVLLRGEAPRRLAWGILALLAVLVALAVVVVVHAGEALQLLRVIAER